MMQVGPKAPAGGNSRPAPAVHDAVPAASMALLLAPVPDQPNSTVRLDSGELRLTLPRFLPLPPLPTALQWRWRRRTWALPSAAALTWLWRRLTMC